MTVVWWPAAGTSTREFKRQLDELMDSPTGQQVNDKLLISADAAIGIQAQQHFQLKAAEAEDQSKDVSKSKHGNSGARLSVVPA